MQIVDEQSTKYVVYEYWPADDKIVIIEYFDCTGEAESRVDELIKDKDSGPVLTFGYMDSSILAQAKRHAA